MTKEKTVTMTKYWLGKPSEIQVTRNEYIETWTTAVSEKGYDRIINYSDYDIQAEQSKKIEDFKNFMGELAGEQWDRDFEEQNPKG
tara:strand:- start:409 stop:666 length:258 start_codon:yes stop_codon:yes gene_type:complete